ncbi:Ankyrin repeat domain-containing protein 17 [Beauveria bassiana D1-5]|uniref:Ankyrin repeat domain-containing protein 17 n=1 Tax=Beauveria bassiana D1-5 TaxID=1245745 RepID=A0A0A2VKL0_BEABA|nr:Ankyrin repeat domain-containing protein 17 [Beauveria bassiana D1-5]
MMEITAPSSSAGTCPNPQASLQVAIQDFQSILTDGQRHKLRTIGSIRDAQSVMIFTAQLEHENRLAGRPGVSNRLSTVLESVQAFAGVVGTFVSSHPEIAALVWGSVKLTMLEEMQEDVRAVQQMGEEVKEEISLATARAQHEDEELQARERRAAFRDRSKMWKFLPRMEHDISAIKEMHEQQLRRKAKEERQRLLESLPSHEYRTPFWEACKKRQRDTAEWIFAVPEFKRCANVVNHVFLHKGRHDTATFFFVDRDNAESLQAETLIRSIIRQSIDSTEVPQYLESRLTNLDHAVFVQLDAWIDLLRYVIQQSTAFYILIDGLDECDAAERQAVFDALSLLAATASCLRIFISSRESVDLDLRGRSLPMSRVSMSCDSLMSDIRSYIDTSLQKRLQNEELAFGDAHLLVEVNDALTQHADGMFLWVTFLIDEICAGSCDDDIRRSLRQLPKDLEETFKRALLRILSRAKHVELVQRTFRWVAVARRPLTLDELREAVSIDVGQTHSRPERLPHHMNRILLWCENLLHLTDEEPAQVQFAHASVRDFITRATLPGQLFRFHVDLRETDHFAGEICVTYLHFSDFTTTIARRQKPVQLNPVRLAVTALSRETNMARISEVVTHFASRRRKTMADPDLSRIEAKYGKSHDIGKETLQNSHPFLQYAATHWVAHTVHFEEKQCIIWDLWLLLVSGCSSLARIPWDRQGLLVWSHKTRHYALLRHALNIERQYELGEIYHLLKISATRGDSKAVAIFLETCTGSISYFDMLLPKVSEGGHAKVVDQLLGVGADANAAADEYRGQTALQAACGGGHLEVVERLLGAGADVNTAVTKHSGQTALQAASGAGHLEVVERLIDAGADVNAATAEVKQLRALQEVSSSGHLEGVVDDHLDRVLDGHLEVVERLLIAKADADASGLENEGLTALQVASKRGHLQVVDFLLGAGADVNADAAPLEGLTALQAASSGGHVTVVERLLYAGADVNAPGAVVEGLTALQAASSGGYLQVVDFLLGVGAWVNATPAFLRGVTALQAASGSGHIEVVKRLLRAGADVNTAASRIGGRTALQVASDRGHLKIVELLLAAGADDDDAAI